MSDASCVTCRHPAHVQRCDYPIAEGFSWRTISICRCDTKAPGLHQIGPAPYDYVYNPAKGQRITVVGVDDQTFTGTVTDYTENKETGEINMTVQQFGDPLGLDP